jgi:hypothetical protein
MMSENDDDARVRRKTRDEVRGFAAKPAMKCAGSPPQVRGFAAPKNRM